MAGGKPRTLDWGEWDEQQPPLLPLSGGYNTTTGEEAYYDYFERIGPSGAADEQQRLLQLRRLVHECSRRLDFVGIACDNDDSGPPVFVKQDNFRVPFIYSPIPLCNFENRITNDTIEDLGSKYNFRFIGDSTTRRLAESFVSIVTGQGSGHPLAHCRRDFSTGGLKVIFDWAPFCSGPLSVGEMLKTVMAEEMEDGRDETGVHGTEGAPGQEENEEARGAVGKRTVIVTAFGIHDADHQFEVLQNNTEKFYRDQLPQDILEQQGFQAAALHACREASAQVSRAAEGVSAADVGLEQDEREGGGGEGGERRRRGLHRELVGSHAQQRRRTATPNVVLSNEEGEDYPTAAPEDADRGTDPGEEGRASSNAHVEDGALATGSGSGAGPLPLPPLVFVMQNNGFFDEPDDFQQTFLDQVRQIQREVMGIGVVSGAGEVPVGASSSESGLVADNSVDKNAVGEGRRTTGQHQGPGVFLLEDSASLFQKLYCYRMKPSWHFREPVKLMEGKMLWDILALVDREMNPAQPPHSRALADRETNPTLRGHGSGGDDAAWTTTSSLLLVGVSIAISLVVLVARVSSTKTSPRVRGRGRGMR